MKTAVLIACVVVLACAAAASAPSNNEAELLEVYQRVQEHRAAMAMRDGPAKGGFQKAKMPGQRKGAMKGSKPPAKEKSKVKLGGHRDTGKGKKGKGAGAGAGAKGKGKTKKSVGINDPKNKPGDGHKVLGAQDAKPQQKETGRKRADATADQNKPDPTAMQQGRYDAQDNAKVWKNGGLQGKKTAANTKKNAGPKNSAEGDAIRAAAAAKENQI